jgi:hypothetical protein
MGQAEASQEVEDENNHGNEDNARDDEIKNLWHRPQTDIEHAKDPGDQEPQHRNDYGKDDDIDDYLLKKGKSETGHVSSPFRWRREIDKRFAVLMIQFPTVIGRPN